ncbi:hypothetical protein [Hymenobacter terricola]|uniref:hypothetical protein n=1 Tax=Hymenobacter terricola TaxID=2819236 RepID=UPI001B30D3A1|nr:hypothetical protein [Hymenobacter terricola]
MLPALSFYKWLVVRTWLGSWLLLAGPALARGATPNVQLTRGSWQLTVAPEGSLVGIRNVADSTRMNWGHWGYGWGLLRHAAMPARAPTVFNQPALRCPDDHTVECVYRRDGLELAGTRIITAEDEATEQYPLTNTGPARREFPLGTLSLAVPFSDGCEGGAAWCLHQNCNAHLGMGGASAWANAVRMSGAGPHLGRALSEGNAAAYSVLEGATSNDRGHLAPHPAAFALNPGESHTMAWANDPDWALVHWLMLKNRKQLK